MNSWLRSRTSLFALGIVILIAMNFYTFIVAYPETSKLGFAITVHGQSFAKDFSAYYLAAWKLLHCPAQVYTTNASIAGEPVILLLPQTYKYLPSFLLLVSPFTALAYQHAFIAFDVLQFAFLPLIALMLYRLLSKKGLLLTFLVAVITLLQPFPTANWGFSPSYFWQWTEGQAKVFLIFLLILSFYLGNRGKPYLSGVAFAFGFFDPRFGLLAIPLFVMYNRKSLKAATASTISALLLSNSMLLYPGLAANFITVVFASAVDTPLYYYSLIPFFSLVALIVVNYKEIGAAFGLLKTSGISTELKKPKNE
jgi:hypothetical protein